MPDFTLAQSECLQVLARLQRQQENKRMGCLSLLSSGSANSCVSWQESRTRKGVGSWAVEVGHIPLTSHWVNQTPTGSGGSVKKSKGRGNWANHYFFE